MNFDAIQQSWFSYNNYNQEMASDCPSTVSQQDTTNAHLIDLDTFGRQPALSNLGQRLQHLNPREQRTGFESCGNNSVEENNQDPMMCLTGFIKHTISSNHTKQDLPRNKRLRTTFSPSQLKRLESEFRCNMYVVGLKRQRLAQELQLEERHIKIWFQNRRMKFKRDQRLHERNASMAYQNFCFY